MGKNQMVGVHLVLTLVMEKDGVRDTTIKRMCLDPSSFNFHDHKSPEKGTFVTFTGTVLATDSCAPVMVPVAWEIGERKEGREMVDEAFEPLRALKQSPRLKETLHTDLNVWLQLVFQAKAAGHDLDSFDDCYTRQIGFINNTTDELHAIGLAAVKGTEISLETETMFGASGSEIRGSLVTPHGRKTLISGVPESMSFEGLGEHTLSDLEDLWIAESGKEKPLEVSINLERPKKG